MLFRSRRRRAEARGRCAEQGGGAHCGPLCMHDERFEWGVLRNGPQGLYDRHLDPQRPVSAVLPRARLPPHSPPPTFIRFFIRPRRDPSTSGPCVLWRLGVGSGRMPGRRRPRYGTGEFRWLCRSFGNPADQILAKQVIKVRPFSAPAPVTPHACESNPFPTRRSTPTTF